MLRRCGKCKRGCACAAFITEDESHSPDRLTRVSLLERSTFAASALRTLLQRHQQRQRDERHQRCESADSLAVGSLAIGCSIAVDCSQPPRVALYLPNRQSAAVWVSACKRLGVPFVPITSGCSSETLASRLIDMGEWRKLAGCLLRLLPATCCLPLAAGYLLLAARHRTHSCSPPSTDFTLGRIRRVCPHRVAHHSPTRRGGQICVRRCNERCKGRCRKRRKTRRPGRWGRGRWG